MNGNSAKVLLDLNHPGFQSELFSLSNRKDGHVVMASLTQEMVTMQTQLTAIIECEERGYVSFCPKPTPVSQPDATCYEAPCDFFARCP